MHGQRRHFESSFAGVADLKTASAGRHTLEPMGSTSDFRLLALHGLRLKGMAPAERVAELYNLDAAELEKQYQADAESDLCKYRDGRVTGWMLTPAGREAGEALVRAEADTAGVTQTIRDGYHRFHEQNQDMLKLCTDWQMSPGPDGGDPVLNDHEDAAYDAGVIERLEAHHDQVAPALGILAGALDRMAGYDDRFRAALAKVASGEMEFFTKPIIDSYHTIWFELHEDLMATLGIERAKEAEYHEQRGH